MAQHQDLCLQRDPRLEKPDQRTPDQSAELDHQADDSPDSPPPANRIRFPTRTSVDVILARHFFEYAREYETRILTQWTSCVFFKPTNSVLLLKIVQCRS